MSKLIISKSQARRFLLEYQCLRPPYELKNKLDIIDYVKRVGCIQFDPLNIVGHNQELVLQARVSNFTPKVLYELLYVDRELLDGWDKNMSIYSTTDWPYFSRHREHARYHLGNSNRPATSILDEVRQEIEEKGPLSSSDLNYNQTVRWSWAPTRLSRAALESMYHWGELVIHHKVNTRKIYDFAKRCISTELLDATDPNQTEEQYHDWYIQRRIGAIGLLWNKAGDAWVGIPGIHRSERDAAFARLLQSGEISEVQVEGIETKFYVRSENRTLLDKSPGAAPAASRAAILAPLDNLLWDRRLVKEFFDFDYTWEVYKPVIERKYGYYVLPVLYDDRFIARFEPGKDKKRGALLIKNWWWEPGVATNEDLFTSLSDCFRRFLKYLNLTSIAIDTQIQKSEGLDWLNSAASVIDSNDT